jgi:hypothetical protein
VQEMIRMGKEIPQKEDKPHVRALPPRPMMHATLTTHLLSHIIRFPFSSLLFLSSTQTRSRPARLSWPRWHSRFDTTSRSACLPIPGGRAYVLLRNELALAFGSLQTWNKANSCLLLLAFSSR